jgi:hypothetical protein
MRHELGSAIRTHLSTLQKAYGLPLPHSPSQPSPVPTRASCFTRAGSQPCATASCPRRDSNPALPISSRSCLLPVGYEDLEPSSGADPDHLPYEGKVTAVCDGAAAGQRPVVGKQGLEPRLPGPGPGALTLTRRPVQWRWQESNPLRQRLQGAPATLAVIPNDSSGPAQ